MVVDKKRREEDGQKGGGRQQKPTKRGFLTKISTLKELF
jgi:hypothetical protein